ncbi:L-seryl-tRNA(Sec) selenium transferase [uncultured Jatrophihabitans sp.]|uniref:L-seryl-tRNA(Sec) selenium transferase n=1 Tax=uncultured Jatrophihabitans sp. TaxID=1610747 RepID=UPI0035CC7E5D
MTIDDRRRVPSTNAVLDDPRLADAAQARGRPAVKRAVVAALQHVRDGDLGRDDVVNAVLHELAGGPAGAPRAVLNATGVVVHTNLGRAPLSDTAIEAMATAARYTDVEFDLASGERAKRGRGLVDALQAALPDAGGVLVVNNGAAAVLLAVTALGAGKNIVISRGELVEIGDGFRLPELLESAGARLKEVGTTNRVRFDDYAAAVDDDTAAVLKVHPSNFRIEGFTSTVPVQELATLPAPVIADIGSGLLTPHPLLPDEPDMRTALRAGAAVVTCSGDKLLGGPQAGLLAGRAEVIERLRRHPLARALRVDKLTIAALAASLDALRSPVWQALTADEARLRERCTAIAKQLGADGIDAQVVPSAGAVGGGGGPGVTLDGWALSLPTDFAARLRNGPTPVVGRVERDRCLLDLRCIQPADDAAVLDAVRTAAAR